MVEGRKWEISACGGRDDAFSNRSFDLAIRLDKILESEPDQHTAFYAMLKTFMFQMDKRGCTNVILDCPVENGSDDGMLLVIQVVPRQFLLELQKGFGITKEDEGLCK